MAEGSPEIYGEDTAVSDRGQDVNLPVRWTPDTTFLTPGVWRMQFKDSRSPRDPVLDIPSEPHPWLNALMDHAILRLMLLANGAVMPLTERVTSTRSAKAPGTYNGADVDRLAYKFQRAKTHRARLLLIKAAQDKATAFTHSPDRELIRGTREWKERIAADDRPYTVLQRVYGVSSKTVAATKKEFRRGTLSELRSTHHFPNVHAVAG